MPPSIEMIEDAPPAATITTILHTLSVPAIGTHWVEQGGVYAGLVRGDNGVDHHLIISTDPTGEIESAEWGKRGLDVPGAASKSDGPANTRALAEAGSQVAKDVLALSIADHADWHIGSQADMHVAFANCAELFDMDDWYWTSTQVVRGGAFVQNFAFGVSLWSGKGNDYRVRAVRTIQLQPFNP
jgi:hypothetical protein